MTASLTHRGPDNQGLWLKPESGIALGHRRLSIVDLSQAGHQPMVSSDGRFVIVYNGEVYNHQEARRQLEDQGVRFRGASDTEVILEACAAWSVDRTLPKLNGMFAFALWDLREQTLTLVRDRLGIKPLYWCRAGKLFLFGSELKALRAHRGWTPTVRTDAVAAYMRHGYIPAPHTIYEGVHKLEPGTVLTFSTRDASNIQVARYWDPKQIASMGQASRHRDGDSDALVEELDALLRDAVGRRMIADVPLGAFLSGGVDSSVVAAMMQAQSPTAVKTYTIGFEQTRFDEAPHARAVARHLGTEHTELYVSPKDALDLIPELSHFFDEPFADVSQIPTLLLSRLTRQHVTVALSGDGGDELFAGYERYFWHARIERHLRHLPIRARRLAAICLRALGAQQRDWLVEHLPGRAQGFVTGSRLEKLTQVLDASDPLALYQRILSLWPTPSDIVSTDQEAKGRLWEQGIVDGLSPTFEAPQLIDTVTYLPDDILTKVDRASMAVGLEARVPLIDYRVVEFAWRLPLSMKVRANEGKWILKQVLNRYVPKNLTERPKMGFGVPMGEWLRGPLRAWAADLVSAKSLSQQSLLRTELVQKTWREHLQGHNHRTDHLWGVLVLLAWLRRWT